MFCCMLLYVHSSIAIILMGKRELIALLNLSSWCLVMVERLFLAVPRGCLQFVIVVFPDHTHYYSWNNSIGNKLFDIKPTIGEYQSVVRNIRKEEVVLARLRLGHTRVTHSYLLQGEERPQCVGCDAPFPVRHFILECDDFAQVRNNCFHVDNMKELFQDIHIDSIMTFLRRINLFNKI